MRALAPLFLALFFAADGHAGTTGPIEFRGDYPPSCLAWPTEYMDPSGPTYLHSNSFDLIDVATKQRVGLESVTFTFWRVACEGGRSALLVRIARADSADRVNRAVQMPDTGLVVRQGTNIGTVRLAQAPNARNSILVAGALIPWKVTLIIENVYRTDAQAGGALAPGISHSFPGPSFDFNQAIDINIPHSPLIAFSPPPSLAIPAYDASLYAAATLPLPVTGYNAGSYYDPAHASEGMIVDIAGDFAGPADEPRRAINLAWFTYDQAGKPFWLFGTATFSPGARSVEVPMLYTANGAFAGGSSATTTRLSWGTVVVEFPNCGSMRFSYTANAGLPAPVPSESGIRTWARLTQQNGLNCR